MEPELLDILTPSGDYTGETASRDECHRKGHRHRGVVIFVIHPESKQILLQQRSHQKKLWPDLWDITSGGHVDAGEFGFEAAIREAKEEIGLELAPNDLICIGTNTSENTGPGLIDRHFNECFITYQGLDITNLSLQSEEVQALQWFTPAEIETRFHHNLDGLVPKTGCWERILRYLEIH